MNIQGIEIGPGFPCRTVAELSNAHNGDMDTALALIGAAKEAGADFVKIQAYIPAELIALRGDGPAPEPWGSQGYSMERLYEQAKTPLEWLPRLFQEARRFDVPMFSSVFGAKSLAALEAVGCPAYKISHFEATNVPLLEAVLATGKPVLLSAKTTRLGRRGITLLYCPDGYPCPAADMKLPEFNNWEEWGSIGSPYTGLSSHCKDPLVAPLAVARGAKLLEYHFMLSWRPSALESNVSLTEQQFDSMVRSVRKAEVLLG